MDWLLVLLITAITGACAALAVFFLPLHLGPVPVPISVLLGAAAVLIGPRACYRLTGSLASAAAPAVAWLIVSVWLVLARSDLYPLVPLTVSNGQWRVFLLLGLGSVSAAATLGLLWAEGVRRQVADRSAADAGPAAAAGPGDVTDVAPAAADGVDWQGIIDGDPASAGSSREEVRREPL